MQFILKENTSIGTVPQKLVVILLMIVCFQLIIIFVLQKGSLFFNTNIKMHSISNHFVHTYVHHLLLFFTVEIKFFYKIGGKIKKITMP